MADMQAMLTGSRQLDVIPEVAFDAWLDAESAAQWLFATPGGVMERVRIEPRVGGGFEIVERRGEHLVEHVGTYVMIDRPRRIVFDFAADREAAPTRVTVTFEACSDGCTVTLSHLLDPQWIAHRERIDAGWTGILAALERALIGNGNKGM